VDDYKFSHSHYSHLGAFAVELANNTLRFFLELIVRRIKRHRNIVPDPVLAAMTIFSLFINLGIIADWTGVGAMIPILNLSIDQLKIQFSCLERQARQLKNPLSLNDQKILDPFP
jgi:hypothetical protein